MILNITSHYYKQFSSAEEVALDIAAFSVILLKDFLHILDKVKAALKDFQWIPLGFLY